MDKTAIIVAIISFAGVIVSGIISAVIASSLIKYRVEQLEKKVDIHNGYAKKFADYSEAMVGAKKDIEWIKKEMEKK